MKPNHDQLAAFARLLQDAPAMPGVFNPWSHANDDDVNGNGPEARRERLASHLNARPRLILIGEAPGYAGCRISGIPFTSEKLLLADAVPRVSAHQQRLSDRKLPWSEPSASIMWTELYRHSVAAETAMWNTFAFHPQAADDPKSNRTPTRQELDVGLPILEAFLGLFGITKARGAGEGIDVVAVGRKAQAALQTLGYEFGHVRHPAMGGANEFRAQLNLLMTDQARRLEEPA